MAVRASLFSGRRRQGTKASGRAAKASSVGAKTVKGPGAETASTSSAAVRAATKVLKDPFSTAVVGISAAEAMEAATARVVAASVNFILYVVIVVRISFWIVR